MPVMIIVSRLATTSTSLKNTEKIGELIGKQLNGGEVIELISDLGGGKTVLVKGIAKGAGSTDLVSSPTFTISKVYDCPKFNINHFDFYRLDDPGLVAHELTESIEDNKSVTVIEWPKTVEKILPRKRITITIVQSGDLQRQIKIRYSPEFEYLFKDLK